MEVKDPQLQRMIGFTLRSGVMVAILIGLFGGTIFFQAHREDTVAFHVFAGTKSLYASPIRTVQQALHPQVQDKENRGLAIAQVGIICLLLTPVIRVAFSLIGFALERDTAYVCITAIVLTTLTISLLMH
ncbi:DUF1634 domain-containing protein [Edaphobacter albus]|uniref:DUF1634 domain-containing protein n=1 Tax=Edaphobacter sp. 4G125 TaxID=2763071 RepID=UPI002103B15C|nr:DUF1634 domain-containing protein [Edaphobacter sp. 4G125]